MGQEPGRRPRSGGATVREEWSAAATPAAVSQLRGAVGEFAARAGVPDPPLSHAKLAVSEAITNVVVHGYPDATEPGPVKVTATLEDHVLRIFVADEGVGFAPRIDSPGSGLGLPVIAALADDLSVEPGSDGGTRIGITFALESDDREG
jgi:anti-sigma regulatory factor (Ser/Thr protein kinase)